MCHQVKSVSLQTAVLDQAKEFAETNRVFSVHDITKNIREKTSKGELEIPEVEVYGSSVRFDIPHVKVKELFDDSWQSGAFDPHFTLTRRFNGKYFEYTPSLVNVVNVSPTNTNVASTAVSVNTATQPTITTTVVQTSKPDRITVVARVSSYLRRCVNRNFRPTIKNVQSAIKRGDVSTGWSCDDLLDIIENDLGFTIVTDPDALSASQVAT